MIGTNSVRVVRKGVREDETATLPPKFREKITLKVAVNVIGPY